MNNDMKAFNSRDELDIALAEHVKKVIDDAIIKRGRAFIAFSGGSTPIGLFSLLSSFDINWSKVVITLVDDRWVPSDHAASNAGMLSQYLLSNISCEKFIPLTLNENNVSAFDAEEQLENNLKNSLSELDLAIMGMGEDGHTASFFPGSPQLDKALDLSTKKVAIATKPTKAEFDRMTLTLSFLLKSRELVLHFTGKKKHAIFNEASALANNKSLPVSFILNQKTPPLTIFYAD